MDAQVNTPVTPIMIEAPSERTLSDAGYAVAYVTAEPDAIVIGDDGGEAAIAVWEPPKPDGDGWVLHYKGWTEDGDIIGVWARPEPVAEPAKEEDKNHG